MNCRDYRRGLFYISKLFPLHIFFSSLFPPTDVSYFLQIINSFTSLNLICLFVLLLGAGGVGGLDQGEELHLGSSGLWEGSEQCAEITTKTQDSGWRTAGSPVTAAGVCACLCFYLCVWESAPGTPTVLQVSVLNFMYLWIYALAFINYFFSSMTKNFNLSHFECNTVFCRKLYHSACFQYFSFVEFCFTI